MKTTRLAPETILVLSFAAFILVGALFLMLPSATTGKSISFIDALFTTTSATCVTGLTVVDTGTYFSMFGQIIVLISIQLGGIGIMTFSTFLLYVFGRRLTVRNSDLLTKTLRHTGGATPKGLLWTVVVVTLIIEAIGAMLLYSRFATELPADQAMWSSVFHSVSAFCNAGFSTFNNNLMSYSADITVNTTIMLLIFLGGIGFIVFLELYQFGLSQIRSFLDSLKQKRHASYLAEAPFRFSTHSKVVISVSIILIVLGAAAIGVLEYNNVEKGMSVKERILTSLFASVTPRTAGFNTVDTGALSDATLVVVVILMFIGASPGSTGGGIKTSTFAVLLGMIRSTIGKRQKVTFYRRSVSALVQSEAVTLIFLAAGVVILGSLLVQMAEMANASSVMAHGKYLELLFETVSAFGTVGLSANVTPTLSTFSKYVLIVIMFIGRLGPLTLVVALSRRKAKTELVYPEGRILIG
jgi:trk system potassium uptake protein TrkH